ncbi:MAG TPA: hypothetical protein VES36_04500, partial [Candidatus Limnocylindrales bacterium]|nr:hypothetical protein [Candidatus Limnocylindrales bacterium]
EVVATVKQSRGSVAASAGYLELPAAQVRAAVRYYVAFPAEVDELLARQEAAAATEQEAARREGAILG